MQLVRYRRRCILIYILVFSTVVLLTYQFSKGIRSQSDDELYCHKITSEDSLPDISDNPPSNERRNIFFLETSCTSYNVGKVYINARQACAVESAARMNPDMDVYLLFASPGVIKDEISESDRILQLLRTYSNIKILHFNVNKYVKDTPVETLWTTGKIKTSAYQTSHTSDVFRFLTLWKFGGIYLDLDIIVLKNISGLPENFAGAESSRVIASGVMGFSKSGQGHEYINKCVNDLGKNFNGKQWAANGPDLISRSIFRLCPKIKPEKLVSDGRCEEFTIFPISAFYLVPYPRWKWFFDEKQTKIIEELKEKSYLTHVWNKLNVGEKIPKNDDNVPYLYLASMYCPGVVQQLDEYF